jgi:hypothetical protein
MAPNACGGSQVGTICTWSEMSLLFPEGRIVRVRKVRVRKVRGRIVLTPILWLCMYKKKMMSCDRQNGRTTGDRCYDL